MLDPQSAHRLGVEIAEGSTTLLVHVKCKKAYRTPVKEAGERSDVDLSLTAKQHADVAHEMAQAAEVGSMQDKPAPLDKSSTQGEDPAHVEAIAADEPLAAPIKAEENECQQKSDGDATGSAPATAVETAEPQPAEAPADSSPLGASSAVDDAQEDEPQKKRLKTSNDEES